MPANDHDQPTAAEAQPLNRAARRAARKGRTAEHGSGVTPEQTGPVHGSQVMAPRQFTGRRGNR